MAAGPKDEHRRARVSPVQTAFHTRQESGQNDSSHFTHWAGTPSRSHENTPERFEVAKQGHQRFVLTDPVAFQYLDADESTHILARHQELQGYECYVVEQWATSRTHPTSVISSYTGDPAHVVFVDVLSVPSDERSWSPRLKVYFKALNQYHARRETTSLGTLMVTNLSSFPSSLTVIPVPGGDIRHHWAEFFVNEDLKRLGCSGRVGLTLATPPANTVAKFYQIYHASDKNKIFEAVVELVELCQLALTLFDKLEPDYADGLLCDVTEHAIRSWWNDIGAEHYGIEPHDGVLGPTTVAAMLGLLMGARNRLHSAGAPVSKDPFDLEAMKRGISTFQKQQRLPRTRRLDPGTVQRLVKVTARAASHEGWTMPRAVKSTVAELSGRGGEMINDVVGRRDRAGIAEIETTDYERFVQLAFGERPRWLWQGKPLKKGKTPDDSRHGNSKSSFEPDQHGGFAWSGKRTDTNTKTLPDERDKEEPRTPGADTDGSDDEGQRFGIRKRATDLKNEAKSGFGKIKGAVNQLSHQQRFATRPKADSPENDVSQQHQADDETDPESPFSGPSSPFSPTHGRMPDYPHADSTASPGSPNAVDHHKRQVSPKENPEVVVTPDSPSRYGRKTFKHDVLRGRSALRIEGPVYAGVELKEALPEGIGTQHDIGQLLRRSLSDSQQVTALHHSHDAGYYPKHLSFSLAEDSVLPWDSITDEGPQSDGTTTTDIAIYALQALKAEEMKSLRLAINNARAEAAEWTQQQLYALSGIVQQSEHDSETLERTYFACLEHLESLSSNTGMLLESERAHLEEGGKELDTLAARLNYEIDGLKGRIEDVGNIVDDFERGVARVEDRVAELEHDGDGSGRWGCIVI